MNKHFSILVSIILAASCKTPETGFIKNDSSTIKLHCVLLPIDVFSKDLNFVPVCQIDTIGAQMELRTTEGSLTLFATPTFLEKHRLPGNQISVKEDKLASVLRNCDYPMNDISDTWYGIIYAGVSAPARVYSDEDVAGRPAGENLSDLLMIHYNSQIKYPNMDFAQIVSATEPPAIEYFGNFFSDSTVPLCEIGADCFIKPVQEYPHHRLFHCPGARNLL
jgi:hypothetical protein